ncbi:MULTISPECIES: helix-turn-helix domain-containing protein [unclassified Paenibacillus]|uniref:helix-turn-helix domain-containing protein n=1 Tax=unclassified Paenibacillus TaxID=185978 RepID=UPI00363D7037
MRPAKYYKQLMVFSICIGLVPVILLGLFSYVKSSEAIEEKVYQGNLHMLTQAKMTVEQVLSGIDLAVVQLISRPSFQELMNHPLTENDFIQYRDLSLSLSNLPFTRSGINSVFLTSLNFDWIISYAGLSTLSDFPWKERFFTFADLPVNSSWVTFPKSAQDEAESVWDGKISLVKKLPALTSSNKPHGLFVMNVDIADIEGSLAKQNQVGDLVILDSSYHVLLDRSKLLANHPKEAQELIRQVKSMTPERNYVETQLGQNVGVTYIKSTYNGWIYLSIVSIQEITNDTRSIALITVLFSIAIFGLTVFLGWVGTKRMYFPIKRLYDSAQTDGQVTAGDRGQDELVYIEERLQGLIQSDQDLKSKMRNYLPQLKEMFVVKLLQNQLGAKEVTEKLQQFGFPVEGTALCVAAVQIDTLENTSYSEEERDLLLFAINNMVGEIIPSHIRLSPVLINQTQVTVIVSSLPAGEEFKREMNDWARNIKRAVSQYLKLKVSIGLSRPYQDFPLTGPAYGEALEALRYRLRLGTGMILHLDELASQPNDTFNYPKEAEDELLNAIRMNDEYWAVTSLNSFIRSVLNRRLSHSGFIFMMNQLLIRLSELVQHDDVAMHALFDQTSLLERISQVKTMEEMEALFLHHVVEPIMRVLEQQRKTVFDNITASVIRLIEEEFDNNLTLEYCAGKINFHPTYVSRVFKKETGYSFSEYLAQFRLNISKKWLKETDLKVQEISERLKYNSPAAFIRYFRNMEGVTPGKYRDHVSQGKEDKGGDEYGAGAN